MRINPFYLYVIIAQVPMLSSLLLDREDVATAVTLIVVTLILDYPIFRIGKMIFDRAHTGDDQEWNFYLWPNIAVSVRVTEKTIHYRIARIDL